jgi:hypothetical protein
MSFKINPYVHEQNHIRSHSSEQFYIDQLREDELVLDLDNVAVDIDQLFFRSFQCNTHWCLRCGKEEGIREYKGSCCTDLEVNITPEEKNRLVKLAELADGKLDLAEDDPVRKVVGRVREDQFTEITDGGELAFKHLRSTRCSMSWVDGDGTLKCAINTLTERLNLNLTDYKPEPCFLFPLHYVEYAPDRYFVTLICKETYQWIGADKYVTKLRCLRKPEPGSPPAFTFLKYELIYCFGEAFYQQLETASRHYLTDRASGKPSPEVLEVVPG